MKPSEKIYTLKQKAKTKGLKHNESTNHCSRLASSPLVWKTAALKLTIRNGDVSKTNKDVLHIA